MKLLKNVGALLTMLTLGYAPFVGAQDNVIKRNWEESTGISKVYFGYTGTTPDVGISHERRKGAMGWDAMLLFSGDDDDGAEVRDEQYHLSTSLLYHLQDNSRGDIYVGTGLAVVMHNDTGVNNDDTELGIGPNFKMGASYYLTEEWSLGLEYHNVFNWTNDMLAGNQTYGLLNLGYTY